jgi:hypothetical protein
MREKELQSPPLALIYSYFAVCDQARLNSGFVFAYFTILDVSSDEPMRICSRRHLGAFFLFKIMFQYSSGNNEEVRESKLLTRGNRQICQHLNWIYLEYMPAISPQH